MTVNAETPRIRYTGNGTTVDHAFLWSMQDANEVFVEQNGVRLEVGVHYDVVDLNLSVGGTIQFYTAPPVDDDILIFRKTPITQQVDYTAAPFQEDVHEGQLDKDTRILQELIEGGLAVGGPIDLEAVPGIDFVDIENTAGLDARIPSWTYDDTIKQLAGVMHAAVVEDGQAPIDGDPTTEPEGFMWLELAP